MESWVTGTHPNKQKLLLYIIDQRLLQVINHHVQYCFRIMHIYIYKVVIPVCLSICLSNHNSWTPGLICLEFWLGNSVGPQECTLFDSKIISWVGGSTFKEKIAKIVIYDKARVNGDIPWTTLGSQASNV